MTGRSFFGVDFSGAKQAGKSIWVARLGVEQGAPRIVSCFRGHELEGSGRERDTCLAALRRLVTAHPDAVFGFDFPFGLPVALVEEPDWETFVLNFPEKFDSAHEFRKWCRERSEQKELKRRTDLETRTPFAPSNLRLYRQTFYGIRDVLFPLVRDGAACVLPVQETREGRAWLLEICPASSLKRAGTDLGLNGFPGKYKGRSAEHQAARQRILRRLEKTDRLRLEPNPRYRRILRARIADNPGGDALDSVLAALAAWRNVRRGLPDRLGLHPDELLEGYVYL